MDELVKRLREIHPEEFSDAWDFAFACQQAMHEAADSIEELATNYDAATDIMKHQTEYIEELEAKLPRWIPVTERLPEICTNVLVAGRMKYRWEHKYLQFVDKAYFNEGEFFETSNDWYEGQDEFEITHWMPLPEPPEEG